MNAPVNTPPRPATAIARELAGQFAQTAVERDERGGTPKAERDALRDSGLLSLVIPQAFGGGAPAGTTPSRWCANSPGSTAPSPTYSASIT